MFLQTPTGKKEMIDFSIPGPLLAGLILGFFLPLPLWILAKLPFLHERNPVQFLLAVIFMFGLWIVLVKTVGLFASGGKLEWLVGSMALSGAALVYLEIWGLLSRGYTLSILATLLEENAPMTPPQIAKNYRGGDGLDWIMRHRLGGLEGAGMVRRDEDRIELAAPGGFLIARLYWLSIKFLGLRRTG
jgi:hypothetical protein